MKHANKIKLAVSAAFIVLIWRGVRKNDLSSLFANASLPWISASILVSLCMVAASCLKWQRLLRMEGDHIPFRRLFAYYFIGYYYTCLLPSNVGGDVARAWLTARDTGSRGKAVLAIFLERISGLIILLLLAITTPLLLPIIYSHPAIWGTTLLAAALLACVAAAALFRNPGTLLMHAASRLLPGARTTPPHGPAAILVHRVANATQRFRERLAEALRAVGTRRSSWGLIMALTLLFYALTWCNVWTSFQAFGAKVPWTVVIAVTPICMMVASIPIAPFGALGLAEGAYIVLFGLAGVPATDALAMGLLLRLKLVLLGTTGMLIQFRTIPLPHAWNEHSSS